MDQTGDVMKILASQASLLPQEELEKVQLLNQELVIGIPKETALQEKRIALTPDGVGLLVANGHQVLVESNAGKNAGYIDNQYSEAGAQICYDKQKVFDAPIVLKVEPPSMEEIDLMKGQQMIISTLQLSVQPKGILKKLADKRITGVAWTYIEDESGITPVVRAMGEIAGTSSILLAAEYLARFTEDTCGSMFGGITGVPSTEVVILGAGTVAEFAASSAVGLGASVKVFDNSTYRLRRIKNIVGQRLWTSIIHPNELEKALKDADVVVGALRPVFGKTPCIVSEAMVQKMKIGSVIIDVSIDQGGCFETSRVTSHDKPFYKCHDVAHYCVPNLTSRVSQTASRALNNIFAPLLVKVGNAGGAAKLIAQDCGFRQGVYMYRGTLTNETLGQVYHLPSKNWDLLLPGL
jgi:alanine dehydrogenase